MAECDFVTFSFFRKEGTYNDLISWILVHIVLDIAEKKWVNFAKTGSMADATI